nr:MAG TPA_asm: hypothetical protein [Caudoviricetes sp.]
MRKLFCVVAFSIFFTIGYCVLYFYNGGSSNDDNFSLPSVNVAQKITSDLDLKQKKSLQYDGSVIPFPSKVKVIDNNSDSGNLDRKSKLTAYSYPADKKTFEKRLTREEIAEAPIIDIIPMNVNGKKMELVVVEKDGMTYDASDGVRVFIPRNFFKKFKDNNMDIWEPR